MLDRVGAEAAERLEPVRRRPGMYVGDTGENGVLVLVSELVSNALDRVLAKEATFISVSIAPDGAVVVSDDGAGIRVDPHPAVGLSFLETVFTTIGTKPTADGHTPHVHLRPNLAGVGVGPVCALSRRLDVETFRDGHRYTAAFERGAIVERLTDHGSIAGRGTKVRFLPDPEIFGDARVDGAALRERLDELALLVPEARWLLDGRPLNEAPGLETMLVRLAEGPLVPGTIVRIAAEYDGMEFECALGLLTRAGDHQRDSVLSYANFGRTMEGGSHVKGLRAGLRDAFPQVSFDRRLVAVLHVRLLHARFEGPTRSRLHVDESETFIRDAVHDAMLEPSDHRISWLEALTQ